MAYHSMIVDTERRMKGYRRMFFHGYVAGQVQAMIVWLVLEWLF